MLRNRRQHGFHSGLHLRRKRRKSRVGDLQETIERKVAVYEYTSLCRLAKGGYLYSEDPVASPGIDANG